MKTAYEIAKEELKDFTYFPSINKIVKCMEIFAEQKACEFLKWNDPLCYDYHPDKGVWVYWDSGIVEYTTEEMYAQFILEQTQIAQKE
jgi:hypothetical protein